MFWLVWMHHPKNISCVGIPGWQRELQRDQVETGQADLLESWAWLRSAIEALGCLLFVGSNREWGLLSCQQGPGIIRPGHKGQCPLGLVFDQCLHNQSDLYLPLRSLATTIDLLISKGLLWAVVQRGWGFMRLMCSGLKNFDNDGFDFAWCLISCCQ